MRTLSLDVLRETITGLAAEADFDLPADVEAALRTALARETSAAGREALAMILENAALAREERVPICQDTGMFNVFLELGSGVSFGGQPGPAADAGIADATSTGRLRASLVGDPLLHRVNTGDNTPAFLYLESAGGEDEVRLTVMPKGGGSENVTLLRMMLPTATPEELSAVIVEHVLKKAPFACPPVIVGVGIGGNADTAVKLSKRALLRPVGSPHPEAGYRELEDAVLEAVNGLGIGPAGLGGDATALGVMIEKAATHIACLPLAVSISCHALRRRSTNL